MTCLGSLPDSRMSGYGTCELYTLSYLLYLGDKSFSVAGPCLWNSLPVTLRERDISLVQFKRPLKTRWLI